MTNHNLYAFALLSCGYAPKIKPIMDDQRIVYYIILRDEDERGVCEISERVMPFYSGHDYRQECLSRRQLDSIIDWLHESRWVNIWMRHYLTLPDDMRDKPLRLRFIQTVHRCFEDRRIIDYLTFKERKQCLI